jgi:hypothetical protein
MEFSKDFPVQNGTLTVTGHWFSDAGEWCFSGGIILADSNAEKADGFGNYEATAADIFDAVEFINRTGGNVSITREQANEIRNFMNAERDSHYPRIDAHDHYYGI